jgi:hypothetical protein
MSSCADLSFGSVPKDHALTNLTVNEIAATKDIFVCLNQTQSLLAPVILAGSVRTDSITLNGEPLGTGGSPGPTGPAGQTLPFPDSIVLLGTTIRNIGTQLPEPTLFLDTDPIGLTVARYYDLGRQNVTSAWVSIPLSEIFSETVPPTNSRFVWDTYSGMRHNPYYPSLTLFVTEDHTDTMRFTAHYAENRPSPPDFGNYVGFNTLQPTRQTYGDLGTFIIGTYTYTYTRQLSPYGVVNSQRSLAFAGHDPNQKFFYIQSMNLSNPPGENTRLNFTFQKIGTVDSAQSAPFTLNNNDVITLYPIN